MIGIISDTHDNITNIKKAVEIFKEEKVDFVIHAGDVVAPATVKYFEGLKMKFIFGNCDGDRERIHRKVVEIGGEHYGLTLEIKHEGKTIAAVHGDNQAIFEKILNTKPDYLIHGHTHTPEDKKVGEARILCPGGHYLGDPKEKNQIMLLDIEKDNARFIKI